MRRSTTTLRLALLTGFFLSAAVGLALAAAAGAQGVPTADLAIVSNTASVKHAKVGDEVTFTIIATNNGPESADFNVTWASEQLQLVSETCDLGISPDTPACEYGTVDPGVTLHRMHGRATWLYHRSRPAEQLRGRDGEGRREALGRHAQPYGA
jgi:uncharacterized repeat protein (TIGR01451 family)